jgi:hypothetical protein
MSMSNGEQQGRVNAERRGARPYTNSSSLWEASDRDPHVCAAGDRQRDRLQSEKVDGCWGCHPLGWREIVWSEIEQDWIGQEEESPRDGILTHASAVVGDRSRERREAG